MQSVLADPAFEKYRGKFQKPNGIDVDMSMYECQYKSARRDTAAVDSVETVDALILIDENGNPIHHKVSPASVLDEKKEEGEEVTLDNL